jgi:hypothetical protein
MVAPPGSGGGRTRIPPGDQFLAGDGVPRCHSLVPTGVTDPAPLQHLNLMRSRLLDRTYVEEQYSMILALTIQAASVWSCQCEAVEVDWTMVHYQPRSRPELHQRNQYYKGRLLPVS